MILSVACGSGSIDVASDSGHSSDAAQAADAAGSADASQLPTTADFYGNPQIAVSLADTQFGGDSGMLVAHTVSFPAAGTVESVRPFIIFVEGAVGGEAYYHKGDGGTFQVHLETDDGSLEHLPSGVSLGHTDHIIGIPAMYTGSGPAEAIVGGDPGDSKFFRNLRFNEPIDVEANTFYHLVYRNTTLDPTAHFVSVDDYISAHDTRELHVPAFDRHFRAVLYKVTGTDTWTRRLRHWSIGEVLFTDGRAYGNGYMEAGSVLGPDRVARYVDATASVRQTFVPPRTAAVTAIHVGAMHVSGTNALRATLYGPDDTQLWSATLADFPTGVPDGDPRGDVSPAVAEFRGSTFDEVLSIEAGQPYVLEVTAAGGVHTVVGTRDGSLSYRFSPQTTVLGRAEYRDDPASPWLGWPLRDSGVDDQFDISFYLELGD